MGATPHIPMAYSYNKYTGTGSLQMLAVPPYIDREHIKVSISNVDTTSFEWVNDNTIKLTAPVASLVKVYRNSSPNARVTDYIDGVPLTEAALDNDSLQAFYLAQEQLDSTQDALEVVGQPNFTAIVDAIEANAAQAAVSADASEASASDAAASAAAAADAAATAAAEAATEALDSRVPRTSPTGSAVIPGGTTAQRDVAPVRGYQRHNETLNRMEWFNGTDWVSMGGGATGAPGNNVFHLNDQVITAPFTIPAGQNAGSFGPLTTAAGVEITISDGSEWTVV